MLRVNTTKKTHEQYDNTLDTAIVILRNTFTHNATATEVIQ